MRSYKNVRVSQRVKQPPRQPSSYISPWQQMARHAKLWEMYFATRPGTAEALALLKRIQTEPCC